MNPLFLLLLAGGAVAAVTSKSKKALGKYKSSKKFKACKVNLNNLQSSSPHAYLLSFLIDFIERAKKGAIQHDDPLLMATELADRAYKIIGCGDPPNISNINIPLKDRALYISLIFATQFEDKGGYPIKVRRLPIDWRKSIWRNSAGHSFSDIDYQALFGMAIDLNPELSNLYTGEDLSIWSSSALLADAELALDKILDYNFGGPDHDTYYLEIASSIKLSPNGAQDILAASLTAKSSLGKFINIKKGDTSSYNRKCAELLLSACSAITRYAITMMTPEKLSYNCGYLDRYYRDSSFAERDLYLIKFSNEAYEKHCIPVARKLAVTPGFTGVNGYDLEKIAAMALLVACDCKNVNKPLDTRLNRAMREDFMVPQLLAIINTVDGTQARVESSERLQSYEPVIANLHNGIMNRLIDDGTLSGMQFG